MNRLCLRRATLLYLSIPAALFLAGWLRGPLALGVIGLLGWAVWRAGWGVGDVTEHGGWRVSWAALASGAGLPALLLVGMSGAGGWGSGDADWFKHDTILRDLIERPWPVVYQTSAGPALLVYYVAFYLPAAVVGKLTGSAFIAGQTLAFTMWLGIVLAAGWLGVLGTRRRGGAAGWWRAGAVFFAFSGLDVLGKLSVNGFLGLPPLHGDWNDIEWWAQVFQYSSNAAALFWAPHQALGAWLPTALVLDEAFPRREGEADAPPAPAERRGAAADWGLPLGLAVLWSPFGAVGLAPLVLGAAWRQERSRGTAGWKTLVALTPGNLAGAALALAGVAFYAARLEPFALPAGSLVAPGRHPMPLVEGDGVPLLALWAWFALLEFGALATVVAWSFRERPAPGSDRREELLWLGLASGILLVLPAFHYGYANDLVMRGGLPALFVLQALVLRMFNDDAAGARRPAALALATLLLAGGAGNAALEYRRHAARMVRDRSWRDDAARQPVRSLFELQRTVYQRPGFDFLRQYLGSAEGFYARRLAPARRPAPAPVAE